MNGQRLSEKLRKFIGYDRAKDTYFGGVDIGGVSVSGSFATIHLTATAEHTARDLMTMMSSELLMLGVDHLALTRDELVGIIRIDSAQLQEPLEENQAKGRYIRSKLGNTVEPSITKAEHVIAHLNVDESDLLKSLGISPDELLDKAISADERGRK